MSKTVCFILLRDISKYFLKGSLVETCDRQMCWLHQTHPNPALNRSLSCVTSEGDLAPVSPADYQYLCKISDPRNRYEVFKNTDKLNWAKTLRCGERAYARVKTTDKEFVPVVIQWVGITKIGFKIGVEILNSVSSLKINET